MYIFNLGTVSNRNLKNNSPVINELFNRYWHLFTTAEYGNCYAFNSVYNKEDPTPNRKSILTGPQYGKISFLTFSNNWDSFICKRFGLVFKINPYNSNSLVPLSC